MMITKTKNNHSKKINSHDKIKDDQKIKVE